MKKTILKILNIIRWFFVGFFILTTAFSFAVILDVSMEAGGAPGYDPNAIFTFFAIVAVISATMLSLLIYLKAIGQFLRRKYFWWRYKTVV